MQMTDPIPNFPGKTVGTTLSDLAHTLLDGYSGYVPTARLFIPAYLDQIQSSVAKLAAAVSALAGQDQAEAQQLLTALQDAAAKVASPPAPWTDADIETLANKLATSLVVSSNNPLSDADHAAIKADIKQALREGVGV